LPVGAAEPAVGAHRFLPTPAHPGGARKFLGAAPLRAVALGVAMGEPKVARAAARENLTRFLAWPNYRHHFLRLGFDEGDVADGGSDRLVDALFAIGDVDSVRRRVQEHLAAGADHVCLQVVTDDMDEELAVYRRLAPALLL
jgi:probable F420-dependent oxidoreductase